MKFLREMQTEIKNLNTQKGWYDKPVPFLQAMMLLVTEVAEAAEAWRQWGLEDRTAQCRCPDPAHTKPEGVGSEFADIFIRLLDDCERWGIDLDFEYERKMAFNETRSFRHGGKNA